MPYLQEVESGKNQANSRARDGRPQGELALLRRIRARAARVSGSGLRLGIGDDCALLGVRPGEELAVTTDLSIAGRHFHLDWHPAEAIGHRVLARGLSDLAAMGARPVAAFLSLALPGNLVQGAKGRKSRQRLWQRLWIDRFYDGLLALAEAQRTPLAGGDLAESPVATADIVLVGAVPRGKALLRSGAHPGDLLYVTGSLGGAASGFARLAELAAGKANAGQPGNLKIPASLGKALAPQLYPQPRIAQGLALRRRGLATAALDLSDGLSTDLARLCEESAVAAEVDAAALPIFPGATLSEALNGGEDYELLFTAAPTVRIPRALAGVPLTCIGRVVRPRAAGPAVTLVTAKDKLPLKPRGWEHFA
jgi:thiamine-monophosphate kinase